MKKVYLISIDSERFNLPNYGLYTIKTFIDDKADLDVGVTILSFSKKNIHHLIKKIKIEKPNFIGFQIATWSESTILNIIKLIKKNNFSGKIIVGGPQVTLDNFNLKKILSEKLIDFSIVGRGEYVFYAVIKHFIKKEKLSNFKNIDFLDTKLKILKLKQFSFPLKNPYMISEELLEKSIIGGQIQIMTSHGCPYNCTYCGQGKEKYIEKDLIQIKKELNFLKDKISDKIHINLLDGSFIVNKKRAIEILNYIINLNKNWTWHSEINIELLNDEIIYLLKKANFNSIEIGLQSSNKNTLKLIKRSFKKDIFIQNINKLLSVGIKPTINTIIGLPNETFLEWLDTIDFCLSIENIAVTTNVLKLLPGTKLFNEKEKFGYKTKDTSDEIISTKTFSEVEIKKANFINKLIKIYLNLDNNETREIVKKNYNYKISHFLLKEMDEFIKNKKFNLLKI